MTNKVIFCRLYVCFALVSLNVKIGMGDKVPKKSLSINVCFRYSKYLCKCRCWARKFISKVKSRVSKKVTKEFDEPAHGHHYLGMEVHRATMRLS